MLSRTKVGSGGEFGVEAIVYVYKHCCLLQLGLQESCNVLLSLGSRILAMFCVFVSASMASLLNAFLLGSEYAKCTHAHAITVWSRVLNWGWWFLAVSFVWVRRVIGCDHACGSLFVSC